MPAGAALDRSGARAGVAVEGRGQLKLGDVQDIPLREALQRSAAAGITRASRPHSHADVHVRRASSSPWGAAAYQIEQAGTAWSERLAALMEPLLAHPQATDLALVGWAHGWAHGWDALASAAPALPHGYHGLLNRRRDSWSQYVPDAHGVQLLSAAHLDKAEDLSDWKVSRLAPGRFLVQARDLGASYAQRGAEPEVVAGARGDFGSMILTPTSRTRRRSSHPQHRCPPLPGEVAAALARSPATLAEGGVAGSCVKACARLHGRRWLRG